MPSLVRRSIAFLSLLALPITLVVLSGGTASAAKATSTVKATSHVKSSSLGTFTPSFTGSAATGCTSAGCDLLTIAPKLLEELQDTEGVLPRKLDVESSKKLDIKKISVDKATFDKMHAEDKMASDKLKEGIDGFSKALEDLEKMLAKRVSELAKV